MNPRPPTPNALLRPPGPRGMGAGVLLSLLVHGLLVGALALGVQWKVSRPTGVEAELWAAVPQAAAPRVQPPPPEPAPARTEPAPAPPRTDTPDAQIATEKAKREERLRQELQEKERQREKQREKEKAEKAEADQLAEKKRKEQDDKRRAEAEQARLDQLRKEQLARISSQAGSGDASSTGSAAKSAGPSASYEGRIRARIKPNIVFTGAVNGNPAAEVEVRLAPDGRILGRRTVRSSGVKEWDEAVERAIDRTEILPRDEGGRVYSPMVLVFKPLD